MNNIEKSYLSLIWLALWSWVLLFIPLFIRLAKIKSRKYSYDNKNIYVEEGVFTKHSITVPLYKIETVRATANILGNGTLTLHSGARGVGLGLNNMEYIKNVKHYQAKLTQLAEKAREDKGIKTVDTF
ncbi:MAG: PH domain-containing protein [Clostridiales bacterium]|nr:PH domain-containing protein [Clostridiales bacterium]